MIQIGRMFGQSLALSGLSLGDLGSDNSSKTSNATTNNQIGVSGTGNISVSGATGPVTIDGGSKLAAAVVAASGEAVTQAYKALENSQERALATVDAAVAHASETALKATPTPAGDVTESQTKILVFAGVAVLIAALVISKRK